MLIWRVLAILPDDLEEVSITVQSISITSIDIYVSVVDRQLRELNDRFDEVNTTLFSCMAALSPLHLFAAYDQEKLVRLTTKFYANDFTSDELARLPCQLEMYIRHT